MSPITYITYFLSFTFYQSKQVAESLLLLPIIFFPLIACLSFPPLIHTEALKYLVARDSIDIPGRLCSIAQ